jgi:hypothetical protein
VVERVVIGDIGLGLPALDGEAQRLARAHRARAQDEIGDQPALGDERARVI